MSAVDLIEVEDTLIEIWTHCRFVPTYRVIEGVAMGNYVLHIEGTGAHHNGITADADYILKETVARLKSHGHSIQHASIVYGGREVHAGVEHDAASPVTVTPSSPTPIDPGVPIEEVPDDKEIDETKPISEDTNKTQE